MLVLNSSAKKMNFLVSLYNEISGNNPFVGEHNVLHHAGAIPITRSSLIRGKAKCDTPLARHDFSCLRTPNCDVCSAIHAASKELLARLNFFQHHASDCNVKRLAGHWICWGEEGHGLVQSKIIEVVILKEQRSFMS